MANAHQLYFNCFKHLIEKQKQFNKETQTTMFHTSDFTTIVKNLGVQSFARGSIKMFNYKINKFLQYFQTLV